MQTEAEVLTDHTELICSTNIERIVTGRDAALKQIEVLIRQLNAISRLTSGIGGDVADHWAMRQGHSFDCWLVQSVDKAMPVITRASRCLRTTSSPFVISRRGVGISRLSGLIWWRR